MQSNADQNLAAFSKALEVRSGRKSPTPAAIADAIESLGLDSQAKEQLEALVMFLAVVSEKERRLADLRDAIQDGILSGEPELPQWRRRSGYQIRNQEAYPFRMLPLAGLDIQEVWGEAESTAAGDRQVRQFYATFKSLALGQLDADPRNTLLNGLKSYRSQGYVIFFLETANKINVVRLLSADLDDYYQAKPVAPGSRFKH